MGLSVCGYVGLSVCPRGYLWNHTRNLYQFFVHVACVRGSILLQHVDDRPHCVSRERGFLPHWQCISPESHARSLPIFMHVAYVRDSVLLWYVYYRPHRLSPGSGFCSPLKMHYRPEKGDRSVQPGWNMLSTIALLNFVGCFMVKLFLSYVWCFFVRLVYLVYHLLLKWRWAVYFPERDAAVLSLTKTLDWDDYSSYTAGALA